MANNNLQFGSLALLIGLIAFIAILLYLTKSWPSAGVG